MVKCADCGFFSVRRSDTLQLAEVDPDWRSVADPTKPRALPYEGPPICLVRAHPLADEVGKSRDRTEFRNVAQTECRCSMFRQWQLDFTPKEHLEMALEEQQCRHEEDSRVREREFQEGLAKDQQRFQGEMVNKQVDMAKENARNARLFVLLGAAIGALVPLTIQV